MQMTVQRRSLRDLVPEVLNVAVPELADLGLFCSAGCTRNEPETFDFVEDPSINGACECGRRPGTEFVRLLQRKWSDLGPLGKIRSRALKPRQLVVSGL